MVSKGLTAILLNKRHVCFTQNWPGWGGGGGGGGGGGSGPTPGEEGWNKTML